MAGSYTLTSNQIFFPGSSSAAAYQLFPLTFGITNPILQTNSLTFNSGTSLSQTGPANATSVLVLTPLGNTVSLTWKGISGDTGVPINPGGFLFQSLPANSTTTVAITSGAAVTAGPVVLIWA